MKFLVVDSQWGADDVVYPGGEHELVKPTAAFLKLAGGAAAAGAIIVLEATDAERAKLGRAVEADEMSLANQEAAQASGAWHEGNLAQFELDVAAGVRTREL